MYFAHYSNFLIVAKQVAYVTILQKKSLKIFHKPGESEKWELNSYRKTQTKVMPSGKSVSDLTSRHPGCKLILEGFITLIISILTSLFQLFYHSCLFRPASLKMAGITKGAFDEHRKAKPGYARKSGIRCEKNEYPLYENKKTLREKHSGGLKMYIQESLISA
jgi:hypothetical protein